jgi:hypothetical protein
MISSRIKGEKELSKLLTINVMPENVEVAIAVVIGSGASTCATPHVVVYNETST